ncbi:probable ATP-dependent DNA helicase HFM1 isoform X7 [Notolabrus celidotus]|uniref:probable ATP-dependent DNA helicase HFM1 isoform X7 n=1 Tax=Notolabrus celidotus TaxID=1203425 RepID=UPI00148FC76E|nr:probable ATP-dependent DNA helicase HFM1 isoform X7 [Notolabrus celidotus]
MLDSDDCVLSLDNLFFEKPTVHKVKPLHQEVSPWHLEASPSLSQIPATQDMQKEAETLSTLYSFSQRPKKFLPPLKGSAGLKFLPSKISSPYSYTDDEMDKESRGGSRPGRCGGLWKGEEFRDYSQGACQSGRGGDETPQDSAQAAISRRCLSLDPPLRRSLFKVQVFNNGGDSSNTDDLSSGGSGGGSQTALRPQTFPSQVTMATAPPPPLPPPALQPPRATVGQAAPPFFPGPPFSPPPLGSSAASGRPPLQAAHAAMQDKGTKRAFVPPMTPQPLRIQGSCESGVLRPVSEIPTKFRSVFNDFPFFNYVQSQALDDVLYTGKNFVVCAPTGSGKTVLFELAIIRLFMETSEPWRDVKAVYMELSCRSVYCLLPVAPIKALCSQCFESWKKKFGPLGLTCKELTGDTEIDDFFEIQDSHIILTTPEKWDSMTRKWKDNCLLQLVRLFLIDEVHVVKDATRGATLEVVVSRMKAVNAYRTAQNPEEDLSMRFVAASATIPNITDIADWLSNESGPATYLDMDESHRPVKLRKVVLGFPCHPNQTEFKFDLSLNYKIANIIQTYSDQKPVLVFCSTRKGVQQSATVLAKDARFIMSIEHKQRLRKFANSILDSKLRDLVMFGVGFHHAGVDLSDRKLIEHAFTLGDLPVLFTTRTLAMGVNLPAHLVVIKSTVQYVSGACEEYSESDLLQMIGRAGRPQFDTSATAVIMTKIETKYKYMKLMSGMEIIESSLHSHLVEHLNAEIVLQTISDVNMALDWIRSTLLYIRALKNPTHYGFSADLDRYGIEAKLQELCLKNLNSLSSLGLIDMDEDINIKPTETGRLMARYCVAFDTMKQFSKVTGTENLSDLILNRHPPFGNQIRESVIHLPKYEVTLEQLPRYSCNTAEIVAKVKLKNQAQLLSRRTAPDHHYVSLVIGDSDNKVVFLQKLTDSVLLKCGSWSKKIDLAKASKGEEISVNLISSVYTGLDIQQKFNVYYSKARRLETENPYFVSYDPSGQRQQLKPEPSVHAEAQRENATSATNTGVGSKRQCNHFCKNKDLCAHDCCKVGVTVARKRSTNPESSFSSYLSDLRIKTETLAQTPVKRLKMRMAEESVSVNMHKFSYKPKERLPTVSRFGGSLSEDLWTPHADIVDLTREDFTQLPDTFFLDGADIGSSVWMNSEPQDQKHPLNQIKSTHPASPKRSSVVSNQGALNEWGDWGDFDEENLVNASETSLVSRAAKAEPQIQKSVNHNTSGFTAAATPVLLRQQYVTTSARTPLRSVSPTFTLSPECRRPGPSPSVAMRPQSRITLDWKKKSYGACVMSAPTPTGPRQSIFSKEIIQKPPENLPKPSQTHVAPLTRRFDFFSSVITPANTNSSNEEEAFIGIFDGIF